MPTRTLADGSKSSREYVPTNLRRIAYDAKLCSDAYSGTDKLTTEFTQLVSSFLKYKYYSHFIGNLKFYAHNLSSLINSLRTEVYWLQKKFPSLKKALLDAVMSEAFQGSCNEINIALALNGLLYFGIDKTELSRLLAFPKISKALHSIPTRPTAHYSKYHFALAKVLLYIHFVIDDADLKEKYPLAQMPDRRDDDKPSAVELRIKRELEAQLKSHKFTVIEKYPKLFHCLTWHPDIIVINNKGKPIAIIEIDGPDHFDADGNPTPRTMLRDSIMRAMARRFGFCFLPIPLPKDPKSTTHKDIADDIISRIKRGRMPKPRFASPLPASHSSASAASGGGNGSDAGSTLESHRGSVLSIESITFDSLSDSGRTSRGSIDTRLDNPLEVTYDDSTAITSTTLHPRKPNSTGWGKFFKAPSAVLIDGHKIPLLGGDDPLAELLLQCGTPI